MNKAKDYTFTLLAKQPLYSLRSQWDKTKDFELFFEMVKCRYFMLIVLFAIVYYICVKITLVAVESNAGSSSGTMSKLKPLKEWKI